MGATTCVPGWLYTRALFFFQEVNFHFKMKKKKEEDILQRLSVVIQNHFVALACFGNHFNS